MRIETGLRFNNKGMLESEKSIVDEPMEEVIRIHALFFKKPLKKQRAVLRLLIWWSIKYYFKTLFK